MHFYKTDFFELVSSIQVSEDGQVTSALLVNVSTGVIGAVGNVVCAVSSEKGKLWTAHVSSTVTAKVTEALREFVTTAKSLYALSPFIGLIVWVDLSVEVDSIIALETNVLVTLEQNATVMSADRGTGTLRRILLESCNGLLSLSKDCLLLCYNSHTGFINVYLPSDSLL